MFKKFGRFSGYFKKVKEYVEKSKSKHKTMTKEEEDAANIEERYCLHWGCEKLYRNVENTEKKLCVFHPGFV